MKGLFVLALCLCSVFALNVLDITPIAERAPRAGSRWALERSAMPSESITFKILLKQRNLDKLDAIFWAVSDPQSAEYGKFPSMSEIKSLVAADPAAARRVADWLVQVGIPASSFAVMPDYIKVATTVAQASKLFTTEFSLYRSTVTDRERVRITGPAHIPTELANDIDFVTGISELIDDTRISAKAHPNVEDDQLITPNVLKSYYQVPATQKASNSKNLQAIAAFTDYFSVGALEAFDQYFNIPVANVTIIGPDCLNGTDGCDQMESDLDVQYSTAMGLHVPTLFLAHGNGEWVLDWAQGLAEMSNPPLVNSVSYGWAETDQCEITTGCTTYGYDSQQYVTRCNTELQILGSNGLTILVSDGDDGAPSLGGASGNCPIDAKKYCPIGGCNHTSTECPELTFTLNSNGSMCFYPMGIETDSCSGMLQDSNLQTALNAWATANKECTIAIDEDKEGTPHFYSSCACSKLKSKSSHGYTIAAYTFEQSNGAVFSADYPTSSPYVTSVAATQFTWNGNNVASEIVASIETGAIITSGGGFSSFQPQQSYQQAAVANWVKTGNNLPPSFAYNAAMRGYPDITFNGHNYQIYASNNTANLTDCPCISFPVDGTSCSSPALAGVISLINDQLLNAGKTPLGFLNPLLYQLAASTPAAFNDITEGSNECNRAYCCEYGYTATKGWDPASGLGSPNYANFAPAIMALKGVKVN